MNSEMPADEIKLPLIDKSEQILKKKQPFNTFRIL